MARYYTSEDKQMLMYFEHVGDGYTDFVEPEDVIDDQIRYIGAYVVNSSDETAEEKLGKECFEEDLIPRDALEDAMISYLDSFGKSAVYEVKDGGSILIADRKDWFPDGHWFEFEYEGGDLTGDFDSDKKKIAKEYTDQMDGDDAAWLVKRGHLDIDKYVPYEYMQFDRYSEGVVYALPEKLGLSLEDTRKRLAEAAEELRCYNNGEVYDVYEVSVEDAVDGIDFGCDTRYVSDFDLEKEAEARGYSYLGEYEDTQECLKNNADVLGVSLGFEQVSYIATEEEYHINKDPDFITSHFPERAQLPAYICDGDFYSTAKGNIVGFQAAGDASSPRNWNNVGTFYTFERSYRSPDENPYQCFTDFVEAYGIKPEGNAGDDFERLQKKFDEEGGVLLPVSVYDHSGREYYVGSPADHIDGRWDAGYCGVIFATADDLKEWGLTKDAAADQLEAEVDMYNDWQAGEVYEATLYTRDGQDTGVYAFEVYTADQAEDELGEVLSRSLGNYQSIEDCVKDNLDELGISVTENQVRKTREETTFKKNGGRRM